MQALTFIIETYQESTIFQLQQLLTVKEFLMRLQYCDLDRVHTLAAIYYIFWEMLMLMRVR